MSHSPGTSAVYFRVGCEVVQPTTESLMVIVFGGVPIEPDAPNINEFPRRTLTTPVFWTPPFTLTQILQGVRRDATGDDDNGLGAANELRFTPADAGIEHNINKNSAVIIFMPQLLDFVLEVDG